MANALVKIRSCRGRYRCVQNLPFETKPPSVAAFDRYSKAAWAIVKAYKIDEPNSYDM